MDPAGRAQVEQNWYQQNVAPQLAAAQEQARNNGQAAGSYNGAMQGQLMAQGRLGASQYGLDFAQQLYNNVLQGRQSYYSGGPALAQTQNNADVSRGLNIAQMQAQQAQGQNAFNLDRAGMSNNYNLASSGAQNSYNLGTNQNYNQFQLGNYGNALQAYQLNQQNQANRFGALTGGLAMLGGGLFGGGRGNALLSGIGNMFHSNSGGGNSFTAPSSSYSPLTNNAGSNFGSIGQGSNLLQLPRFS